MKLEFIGKSEKKVDYKSIFWRAYDGTELYRYWVYPEIEVAVYGIKTDIEFRIYFQFSVSGEDAGKLSFSLYEKEEWEHAEQEIRFAVKCIDFKQIKGMDGIYYIHEHLFRSQTGYILDTTKKKLLEMNFWDAIDLAYF